jgi:hypothetical protein
LSACAARPPPPLVDASFSASFTSSRAAARVASAAAMATSPSPSRGAPPFAVVGSLASFAALAASL